MAVASRRADRLVPTPQLFLLLEGARPLSGSTRHLLGGVSQVELGRGTSRAWRRQGRELRLSVPDLRMSSVHARLVLEPSGWHLEDAGSKNGVLLEGEPVARRALEDGAVFQLGHTLFLFRSELPAEASGAEDVDGSELRAPAKGLETLDFQLAAPFERLGRAALSTVPILLGGPTGSGKEVVARAAHALSGRPGAFVAVNCGAIPAPLVESQLFGHRKGAFTGATRDEPGLVRAADRGTLFLDEIGDLPLPSQAALLRVLQEHEVQPVGSAQVLEVDLRCIAATHRNLPQAVARGEFRADLLARLSGFELELPALSARRHDLGLLVATLLAGCPGGDRASIEPDALRTLARHAWPSNVRELEQCITTAAALAAGASIELEHLPRALREPQGDSPVRGADGDLAAKLEALLTEHEGNVAAVARALGKAPTQIRRWMARHGLECAAFRRQR